MSLGPIQPDLASLKSARLAPTVAKNQAVPADRFELSVLPTTGFEPIPSASHLAITEVKPEQLQSAQGKDQTAALLLRELKRWPSLTATIAMASGPDHTQMLVASRDRAVEQADLQGIYEVNKRLSSSPSLKELVSHFPSAYQSVQAVAGQDNVSELQLPGSLSLSQVEEVLAEGSQTNQYPMLQKLIADLPTDRRVAILVGGPSASGKSGLIDQIKEYSGQRPVTVVQGDMYFKDVDQAGNPATPQGNPFFDHQDYMDMDLLKRNLSELIANGKADTPVYNFKDVRPGGWRLPNINVTGHREDQPAPVTLGNSDILVLDSIHATNPQVIEHLESLGIEYRSVYLDSPSADDRLLRKVVRDYDSRGGRSTEQSVQIWDETTWPGETQFIRPGILKLDPARDLFMNLQFPADLGLTRQQIESRDKVLDQYGLAPTYEGFKAPESELPRLAQETVSKLETSLHGGKLDSKASEKAQKELQAIRNAPRYHEVAALTKISKPRAEMTAELQKVLGDHPFRIPAATAQQLADTYGLTQEQLMVELIPVAREFARPPISDYQVGAVGRGASGDLYMGVNLEFPGQALNQSVYGEQFVVAQAMAAGETSLQSIAVSAEPCGHCRQFLNELKGAADLKILIPDQAPVQLKTLLPRSFGPGDLGVEGGLLATPPHGLHLQQVGDELTQAARQAADIAYAPYSKCPSGVALKLRGDDTIYRGSYAENAAFNPSLSPLQAALVQVTMAGRDFADIERAVLVEKQADADKPSQEATTRQVLDSIRPGIDFQVAHVS